MLYDVPVTYQHTHEHSVYKMDLGGRTVAVKQMTNETRFKREIATMSKLNSPYMVQCYTHPINVHIKLVFQITFDRYNPSNHTFPSKQVQYLDSYSDKGLHLVAMEYMAEGDLSTLLTEQYYTGIPSNIALRLAEHVLRGLIFLHGAGYSHRDLKPANIMLTRDENGSLRAKIGGTYTGS